MILADSTLIVQGTTLPSGTQFVPMIYAASDATTANLNTAKSYKTGIVLGFNEPNEANQADNTVAVGVHLSLDHCVGKQDPFRGMLIGQPMPMGAGYQVRANHTILAEGHALPTDVLFLMGRQSGAPAAASSRPAGCVP